MFETQVTADIAQTAVSALHAEAQHHKRLSRQHRDAAGAAMRRIDNIIRQCRAIGIDVEIVHSQKGTEHGTHPNT